MASFEIAIEELLLQEGGYVNDPDDTGGETKYGISKRAFPHLDIQALTVEEAKNIYRQEYWRFEAVESQAVANKLLSMAVHLGLSQAVRQLQKILLVNTDGIFGPKALAATNAVNADTLLQELRIASAVYYCYSIYHRPKNIKYARGWMRRALS